MIVAPCGDCRDRHKNCWSDCASYKLWRLEQDAIAQNKKLSDLPPIGRRSEK